MSCILKAEHVSYTYQGKYQKVHALKDVSCTFEHGRFYAVVGRSGSGKTTLLSLLAGLDKPTQGEIFFEGKSYAELDAAKLRREKLSIVFQNFQLFPLLTVEENIMYPMELRRVKTAAAKEQAGVLLEEVGLSKELRKKYPAMLSGGEQQRVAIARALGSGARVILADEPTGNLDFENGENIIRILKRLVEEENYCVILVTHDRGIAEQADIVYQVQDGRIDYANRERS
ncbi:MAG: ABC transporter ATP-binding protein [Ruminococcus sp.]|nr:ABC transporter ATP-binding protein [Ruminococcus sp.]